MKKKVEDHEHNSKQTTSKMQAKSAKQLTPEEQRRLTEN